MNVAAIGMFGSDFEGRILGFGSDAAPVYAEIVAGRRRGGRPIAHFDAQIAAIARCAGAAIATRNVVDFERCGVKSIDPWGRVAGPALVSFRGRPADLRLRSCWRRTEPLGMRAFVQSHGV